MCRIIKILFLAMSFIMVLLPSLGIDDYYKVFVSSIALFLYYYASIVILDDIDEDSYDTDNRSIILQRIAFNSIKYAVVIYVVIRLLIKIYSMFK